MNLIDSLRWATLFSVVNTVYMYSLGWSLPALCLTYSFTGAISFLFLVLVNTLAKDHFARETVQLRK